MSQEVKPEKLIEWKISIEKVAPLLAGGVAFATIRTAYFQYYAVFGLTPESVGIGSARILSDLLIGPVLLGVFLAFLCLLAYVGQLRLRGRGKTAWRPTAAQLLRVGVMATLLGMLASAIYLVSLARVAATNATTKGIPFSSVRLDFSVLQLPLLQISARHVGALTANAASDQSIVDLKLDPCLIVVGENDGRTYLYETKTQRLYTVSTNSVNYWIDATGTTLDPSCKPTGGFKRQSH